MTAAVKIYSRKKIKKAIWHCKEEKKQINQPSA